MRARRRSGRQESDEEQLQRSAFPYTSRPEVEPHHSLLDLQRLVGNQVVSAGLALTVQRANGDSDSELTELSSDKEEEEAPYGQVISGHGRFNENKLASHPTLRRKKKGTFEVPADMEVRMYAPPGAALDNAVANRIERGDPPPVDELELRHKDSASKTLPMPTPYPYVFGAEAECVDYTVSPPDRLKVEGEPVTVSTPTALRELVAQAKAGGHRTVHYACCGSSYAVSRDFQALFTHSGYYVRFKVEDEEEEEEMSE